MKRIASLAAVVWMSACGLAEFRVDESNGLKGASGKVEVAIPSNFVCGSTTTTGGTTVTSEKVSGGCQLTAQRLQVLLSATDAKRYASLKTGTAFLKRIELALKTLSFADGNGATIDLSTQVTTATFSVNGQQVVDKTTLTSLPALVTLSSPVIDPLKAAFAAGQDVSATLSAVLVLPDSVTPPSQLNVTYVVQPALIFGL